MMLRTIVYSLKASMSQLDSADANRLVGDQTTTFKLNPLLLPKSFHVQRKD